MCVLSHAVSETQSRLAFKRLKRCNKMLLAEHQQFPQHALQGWQRLGLVWPPIHQLLSLPLHVQVYEILVPTEHKFHQTAWPPSGQMGEKRQRVKEDHRTRRGRAKYREAEQCWSHMSNCPTQGTGQEAARSMGSKANEEPGGVKHSIWARHWTLDGE